MNIKKLLLFFVIIVILTFFYCSPKQLNTNNKKSDTSFLIMSYNVENLFDLIDNPDKEDDEFLPNSEKQWNAKRYNKKIDDLSRVISSIKKDVLPDIVGLVEVENREVVKDLASSSKLQKADYGIVHEESPDARGIDVALMYKKTSFTYLNHEKISVNFDFEPETKTRDILYVKGKMNDQELLHIFVNHWSSRREGQKETEPKRLYAASLLKNKVDQILREDNNAKIVILGDFNDEPQNKSLCEILDAGNSKEKGNKKLYNLLYNKDLLNLGTYNYKGKWNMLDNIIVSNALLNSKKGYVVATDEANIFSEKWMLFYNKKYDYSVPNKTYGGPKYYGGISDHLPVFVELIIK